MANCAFSILRPLRVPHPCVFCKGGNHGRLSDAVLQFRRNAWPGVSGAERRRDRETMGRKFWQPQLFALLAKGGPARPEPCEPEGADCGTWWLQVRPEHTGDLPPTERSGNNSKGFSQGPVNPRVESRAIGLRYPPSLSSSVLSHRPPFFPPPARFAAPAPSAHRTGRDRAIAYRRRALCPDRDELRPSNHRRQQRSRPATVA